jgi:fused signal recognition particle receptor
MAGFFKKVFSFGKKEVVEKPAEDEALAPINWDALKELRREHAPAPAQNVAPVPPLDGEGGERSEPGGVLSEEPHPSAASRRPPSPCGGGITPSHKHPAA